MASCCDIAIRKIRLLHRLNPMAAEPADSPERGYNNCDPICLNCGEDWPCRTIQVYGEVTDG